MIFEDKNLEELVEYQCQTLERILRAIIRNCVENEKLLPDRPG